MCVMAIGGILGAVGSIAGAVVGAAGAQQQAEAKAQADEYNAAVQRNLATAEAYKGATDTQATLQKGAYTLATARVNYLKSGTMLTGTPLTVMGQTASNVGYDAATQGWNARVNVDGRNDQAKLFDLQAQNDRKAGQVAATSALIGGVTGLGKVFSGGGAGSSLSAFG